MTAPTTTKTDHQHPLWKLLDTIQMDIRQLNARITELRSQISQLDIPKPNVCDICGYRPAMNMPTLEEHTHLVHEGPIPEHWARDDEANVVGLARAHALPEGSGK